MMAEPGAHSPNRRVGLPLLLVVLAMLFGVAVPVSSGSVAAEACSPITDADTQSEAPVSLILDTDFGPDVDDVGALAVLHALADAGQVDLLGVMVSNGDGRAPRAVDAVNTYYGRPDIPIGTTLRPATYLSSRYTFELSLDFPNDLDIAPDAVALYRQILAAQPDGSVTIVSIGFLTNLAALLHSEPDAHSDLAGAELVAAKVVRLVVMGGQFPDSTEHPDGAEFNLALDPTSAVFVADAWSTPIVFSGFELGVDIETGALLATETPADNPVRVAYDLFNGGVGRSSWDLTAVHYAVLGAGDTWTLCGPGRIVVSGDGANTWEVDTEGTNAYLTNAIPKADIAAMLDALLIQPPQ